MNRIIRLFGLFALVLISASAGIAQQSPSAADSLAMQLLPATFDRPINPDLYLIRPGEVIRVTFLQSSLSALQLEISSDGQIVHPSLGIIDLRGTTLAQAREKLVEPLRSRYNVKDMVLTVGEPRPISISITGAVRSPGFYRVYNSQRVSDALALAGGITSDGSTRNIVLSGGPKPLAVDLDRALYLGDDAANPSLYAGYHLDVPVKSAEAVQVLGEVLRPREIELRPDDDLSTLLDLAGGLTSSADSAAIRLLGQSDRNIWQPGMIKAKDIIQVPRRSASAAQGVSVLGEVKSPGRFSLQSPLTLSQALEMSGGPTEDANVGRITVFRIAETDQYTHASRERYPIIAANEDFLNIQLKPMDSVFVPRKLGWVRVSGPVKAPGLFPYVEGKDAEYYIFTAGGMLPTADPEKVGLVNRISHVRRLVSVNTRVLDGDEVVAQLRLVAP
ncbi:MAG: SLBB domain-containing protein [bacterium]|nr:SLBB domain-containing protein [bacterium]